MRILIVEDDKIVSMLLKRLFTKVTSEEKISVATTLSEARAAIINIPPPDLVTLDLALPDSMTPSETLSVIHEIKEKNPHAVVVVMTGVSEDFSKQAREADADGFLTKPSGMSSRVLMESIKSAFSTKMPFEKRLEFLERITTAMS